MHISNHYCAGYHGHYCAFSAPTRLVGRQEEHQASVNWLMRCWCGYLSGAMCRSSLASFKSKLVLCFWYRLTQAVLEKRPQNGCSSSTVVKTSQMWQSAQLHSGGYTATSDPERGYDTRCYFNVRSKADISQLNLPHGWKQILWKYTGLDWSDSTACLRIHTKQQQCNSLLE